MKIPHFLSWLRPATLLAVVALVAAAYAYFAGEAATLPVRTVAHLTPVPVVLDSVAAGPTWLPLPLNGYAVTLTHDVAGPYTHPTAAGLWLLVLAGVVAGWLGIVSSLERPAFLAGTGPVIFLLFSLNVDVLDLFAGSRPYFLWLSLAALGAASFGLHLWAESWRLGSRVLVMGAVVAALVALVVQRTPLPLPDTALLLAAYATPAGASLLALLVLWLGVENVRGLLWLNTQAATPAGRFGQVVLVLAVGLYLAVPGLYWWSGYRLPLGWGRTLDPLALLLPALAVSAVGLRLRAPSLIEWVPYPAVRVLLGLLVAGAAAGLGYQLYTANDPALAVARAFSAQALVLLGAAFLLYLLLNFGPLLQRRLPVYRVVFEPRRLPLYAAYLLGVGALVAYGARDGWSWLDQVKAAQNNLLGDATRQQSEARPDDLPLALLAESYYAQSGDVLDRFNRPAQLGRAALYRFRSQVQNEQNALVRALRRQPDERVSLRLAALLTEPSDFLDALQVLGKGHRTFPRSFALTSDLAQLFTRSHLTDSVATYLDEAERLAPGNPVIRTNQLGFLLNQGLLAPARKLAAQFGPAPATAPALAADETLLPLLASAPAPVPALPAARDLEPAEFAQLYHAALLAARTGGAAPARLLPRLAALAARPANEPYYEQLLYLQSLLLHAAGQELAARHMLAPLAAGSSASAAYYQYVLGLWQLQQRQYLAAVSQLGRAATLGTAEARPAYGWALALAGQPDSARAVAGRLVTSPEPVVRRQGQQLAAALAAGPVVAGAPVRPLTGQALLAQAQAAAAAGHDRQAERLYHQVVAQAPFNAAAVLAAGQYFGQHRQEGTAYEVLQLGLRENPDDPALLQAFALAAASAGVADLGESALGQLRSRLSPAAYANLLAQFAARRAAHQAAMSEFSNGQPASR